MSLTAHSLKEGSWEPAGGLGRDHRPAWEVASELLGSCGQNAHPRAFHCPTRRQPSPERPC